jgi:hypothetical protein
MITAVTVVVFADLRLAKLSGERHALCSTLTANRENASR